MCALRPLQQTHPTRPVRMQPSQGLMTGPVTPGGDRSRAPGGAPARPNAEDQPTRHPPDPPGRPGAWRAPGPNRAGPDRTRPHRAGPAVPTHRVRRDPNRAGPDHSRPTAHSAPSRKALPADHRNLADGLGAKALLPAPLPAVAEPPPVLAGTRGGKTPASTLTSPLPGEVQEAADGEDADLILDAPRQLHASTDQYQRMTNKHGFRPRERRKWLQR